MTAMELVRLYKAQADLKKALRHLWWSNALNTAIVVLMVASVTVSAAAAYINHLEGERTEELVERLERLKAPKGNPRIKDWSDTI